MEYNTVTLIPGFDVAAGGKPDVWMPSPLALVVFDGAGAISVYRRNTQNDQQALKEDHPELVEEYRTARERRRFEII
jgi:hypothetical protein